MINRHPFAYAKNPLHHRASWLRAMTCVLAAACSLSAALAGQGPPRQEFFAPAEPATDGLAPDRLYPQGEIFPISFFSVGGDERMSGGAKEVLSDEELAAWLARYKADGFTAIGPQYERNPFILDEAADLELWALYSIRGGPEEGGNWSKNDLRTVDREEVEASIRERMKEVLAHEHADRIGWWYLQPEELRHWRAHEMRYLEAVVDVIRDTDPQKRPIWMYDPGHRNAAALGHTARHLDIVGKGMYTNYSGLVNDRVWTRWTIEQQNKAIREANPEAVSIAVPEMFQHPGEFIDALAEDEDAALEIIPRWVRHDVYSALVAGAKGVVIFSLRERPVAEGRDGLPLTGAVHETYYQAYADIAGELTGDRELGRVFLFGEPRDDVEVEIVAGPQRVELGYRDNPAEEYPAVALASLAYGDARYFFAVNQTPEPVFATIPDLPFGHDIEVLNLFTGQSFPLGEGEIELSLRPWGVVAYRVAVME